MLREPRACYSSSVTLLLSFCFNRLTYNFDKVGFKAGTTYQRTIDIRMGHEFADVAGGNAATVENTQGASCLIPIHIAEQLANKRNNLPCTLGGSRFACTDSPDRFIGDHYFVSMLLRKVCQAVLHLEANHLLGLTRFVLILVLANTYNGTQAMMERCLGLFIHHFVAFTKIGTSL